MATIPWAQNDVLFRSLVSEGHAWQTLPYVFLSLAGLTVEMPALSIRNDISQADAWLETYDLKIAHLTLEVKSRPFAFTSPRDWPAPRLPAFLDTVKKWEAKSTKPFAYIFISKATGGMVATCATAEARGRWGRLSRRDRVRDINEDFYTVGRKHLVTMDILVRAVREAITAPSAG